MWDILVGILVDLEIKQKMVLYVGKWKDGKKHGQETYTYPDIRHYK